MAQMLYNFIRSEKYNRIIFHDEIDSNIKIVMFF